MKPLTNILYQTFLLAIQETLLLTVIKPSCLSQEDLQSPKCICKFQVREMLLRRFVAGKERE